MAANPSLNEKIGVFMTMKMVPKKIKLHASAIHLVAAYAYIYCAIATFST